jgi:hypothetical protein
MIIIRFLVFLRAVHRRKRAPGPFVTGMHNTARLPRLQDHEEASSHERACA